MKKGNDRYLWSGGKNFTPCAARAIISQRENLNYLIVVCFTQCIFFFQYVCFLLPICFPCISCGINAMSWHNVRQTFASLRSLGLFTFARIACLLLSLNQTRIAERRFLTGLQRGYFFWVEGAAIHTQATLKPCWQPLHATESHVRLKHKLIQNKVPFWKTFVTKKKEYHF